MEILIIKMPMIPSSVHFTFYILYLVGSRKVITTSTLCYIMLHVSRLDNAPTLYLLPNNTLADAAQNGG